MLALPSQDHAIVSYNTIIHRYTNTSCINAASVYNDLEKSLGSTYLIYLYENLITNEKHVYSSNWEWQNLLIGQRLINYCPLFLNVARLLRNKKIGQVLFPWHQAPAKNKEERNICGLRSEFNISNGFGYAIQGNNVRETLGFGGNRNDSHFYKNFIFNPSLIYNTLEKLRLAILLNRQDGGLYKFSLNNPISNC